MGVRPSPPPYAPTDCPHRQAAFEMSCARRDAASGGAVALRLAGRPTFGVSPAVRTGVVMTHVHCVTYCRLLSGIRHCRKVRLRFASDSPSFAALNQILATSGSSFTANTAS